MYNLYLLKQRRFLFWQTWRVSLAGRYSHESTIERFMLGRGLDSVVRALTLPEGTKRKSQENSGIGYRGIF